MLGTLLYGAETWTIYKSQMKKLHAYMNHHPREIMNLSWKDKITNKVILEKTGLVPMTDILIQMNLSWLVNVERMDFARLPRQMLYSQLDEKESTYLSVNVFSTKVLIRDTIFMSPNGEGTTILRGHPSHVKLSLLAVQREYLHFSVILRP